MNKIDLSGLELPEKEQKILEAAIGVFSEKGFSAATTSEIAKNAGIAEGTIFRYFKTKKDILRSILIHTINMLSSKFVLTSVEKILRNAEQKDLRSVIKDLLIDRINLVDSIFPMARIILSEALFHDDIREVIYNSIISKALPLYSGFHKQMVDKGMIRSDVEPEAAMRCIIGTAAVLIAQKKLFGDKFKLDIDSELEKALDVLLYGISSKS